MQPPFFSCRCPLEVASMSSFGENIHIATNNNTPCPPIIIYKVGERQSECVKNRSICVRKRLESDENHFCRAKSVSKAVGNGISRAEPEI